MTKPVLCFDMDGVLAEVSESYIEGIVQTVRHFTGQTVSRERIHEYKNLGGYNNDWVLSRQLCLDHGVEVDYQVVVDHFCRIFFGENNDGLINREQWMPSNGLLERLQERYRLAIFTGRNLAEARVTLEREGCMAMFDPIVTADDVVNAKPAPDGLELVRAGTGAAQIYYTGDTVDDARSARAAGVPFIGIAAKSNPRFEDLVEAMKAERAMAIIEDVNEIEGVLP